MKIIGVQGNGVFIATVTRVEIEKLYDKYYTQHQAMPDTKVGVEYDLSAGHDFRNEIRQVCREMTDAVTQFNRAQGALLRFASMMAAPLKEDIETGSLIPTK